MKRRGVRWIAGLAVFLAVGYGAWAWYSWDTVCVGASPDGARAVIRCHWMPTGVDVRYHYYLHFDPPIEFRPVGGQYTLKDGASAVKRDRITYDWATRHFIGYLQGFDDVREREPISVEWDGPRVTIRSQKEVAMVVELRQ